MNGKRIPKNRWIIKIASLLTAFAVVSFVFGDLVIGVICLPDAYYAENGQELISRLDNEVCPHGLTVEASIDSNQSLADVAGTVEHRLFGLITVKKANAYIGDRVYLTPSGLPVGISIFTEGVLVVGLGSFTNNDGKTVSPASDAGVKAGDLILKANGIEVSDSASLQSAIDSCGGNVLFSVKRNDDIVSLSVRPQMLEDGSGFRIGAWIRDSTVGIGTLTYFESGSGNVSALGHSVTDADTGVLLNVREGRLTLAEVVGVSRGQQGAPGELQGTFGSASKRIGSVEYNGELGVFGYADSSAYELLCGNALPVAFPDEVHTGYAEVLAALDGGEVRPYGCRILKTGSQSKPAQKGLVIEITDERLLELTGGIVQGMSGCPIIQDGRLAGVVTHVFVNDPTRGYGAYVYWVYKSRPIQ